VIISTTMPAAWELADGNDAARRGAGQGDATRPTSVRKGAGCEATQATESSDCVEVSRGAQRGSATTRRPFPLSSAAFSDHHVLLNGTGSRQRVLALDGAAAEREEALRGPLQVQDPAARHGSVAHQAGLPLMQASRGITRIWGSGRGRCTAVTARRGALHRRIAQPHLFQTPPATPGTFHRALWMAPAGPRPWGPPAISHGPLALVSGHRRWESQTREPGRAGAPAVQITGAPSSGS